MKTLYISVILILNFSLKSFCQHDVEQIPYEDITINCTQPDEGNYIINSDAEYKTKMQIRSPHPQCVSYELPKIDFNKYTLLGISTSTRVCVVKKIDHFVKQNNVDNNIEFNLNIIQEGDCKQRYPIAIWCLISKVSDTNKIKFKINYK